MILFSKILGVFFLLFVLLGLPNAVFADDPLGAWSNTTSLPYLLASHGSFSRANRVSVVGGSAVTGQSRFDVLTATPSADGGINSWTTTSLTPTALIFHSLAKKDSYVYILGGREENPGSALAHVPKVFVGDVNNNGTVNSWTQLNSLPQGTSVGRAVVVGDRIYYAGGFNNSGYQDEIYYADINPVDGTLGAWTPSTVSLPEPLIGFGMVEYGNNIIVFGGETTGGIKRNNVYKASIDPIDGSLSGFTPTEALPEPVYRGSSLRIGSTLISASGHNGTSLITKVYYTQINSDGTVDLWQESANTLPQGMTGSAMAYANGFLYVTGGFGSSGYLNTVYYAPLNVSDGIDLSVPLLKQIDPLWGSFLYDSADLWAPPEPDDIARWGCALTSAAMVFQYHGITKLPNGIDLNPGTLNVWLKNYTPLDPEADGYIRNGLVNWLALERFSKLAKDQNPDFTSDALDYVRHGEDYSQLKSDLENNIPGILGVNNNDHFVVAKGINSEDIFTINDPYYDRDDLTSYSNHFLSLGRFIPSDTDLSYIMLVVDEEVNVSVKNSSGDSVGESYIQQPLENDETPGDFSGESLRMFYLPDPTSGNYELELSSSSNNSYNLDVYYYDVDGNVHINYFSGIVGPEDKDNYSLLFDKNNLDNSNSSHIVTFDSLINDINSLYNLGEINFPNRVLLLAQAKVAKRLSGNNIIKKASINILKAMQREITKKKGKGVSENAFNILNADIKSLLESLN